MRKENRQPSKGRTAPVRKPHQDVDPDKYFELDQFVSQFLDTLTDERVVVLAPDFTILDVNSGYLDAVKKLKGEVLGRRCYEIAHRVSAPCSEHHPELGCPLLKTLETGASAQIIHMHPISELEAAYCEMVTYPIKNRDGQVVRVIEIWRDISEPIAHQWDRRLERFKTQMGKFVQEDRMISLGKLAASCAHEINNPIQGMLTFCDLMSSMLSGDPPSREELALCREYLGLISAELERCGSIVSGLLAFSRESVVTRRDVDLNEVIQMALSLCGHKVALQEISVDLQLSPDPLIVNGDLNKLQQCFLNLIFNAIEAMPQGGTLTVTSRSDKESQMASIAVRDTGCGISKEDMERIFDPFFTTKKEGQGTGLGLSITYGIVKVHSGTIRVSSNQGEGTTFVLTFPMPGHAQPPESNHG